MKWFSLLTISSITFGIGILLFAYHADYIIIHIPPTVAPPSIAQKNTKRVTAWYWKQHAWHSEHDEIIWSDTETVALKSLLSYWLRVLKENDIIPAYLVIQSVMVAPNGQMLFISFNEHPLNTQWPLFYKWLLVESLLKTIRSNTPTFQTVMLLVNHHLLIDSHLDFSHPWPINGYQESSLQ